MEGGGRLEWTRADDDWEDGKLKEDRTRYKKEQSTKWE